MSSSSPLSSFRASSGIAVTKETYYSIDQFKLFYIYEKLKKKMECPWHELKAGYLRLTLGLQKDKIITAMTPAKIISWCFCKRGTLPPKRNPTVSCATFSC